jgi:hypothetical protein
MSITLTYPDGTTEEIESVSIGYGSVIAADRIVVEKPLDVSEVERRLEAARLGLTLAGKRLREAMERQQAETLAVINQRRSRV